ncbi:TetR/AcrR family transcriptional regulator [Streptomyces boncukensis]|uniref:TetR/AcrR family transcriptional regulator n=1 Tax=Streptomyces boncukensis TaxID=2711219 RepID=A0A6G4WZ41_9ACTN|nr:TetR/AcrR family transcriptional regulator [Streptomyces boncukensis]NGO69877.1 TetR/AcrR family transcriptional regulator [Streptomyces boncukensis]
MARVSQAHLEARRRQILDGARRCFLRDGFHAASMQDVLREAGLSAGAVYRYFRSKDEIVAAVAHEALGVVRAALDAKAEAEEPPAPDELFAHVFAELRGLMGAGEDPRELPRLLLQIWSEALRNPELAEVLTGAYAHLAGQWSRIVADYQRRGWVDPGADREKVARTLIGTVQGYFVQQALFGTMCPADFEEGLRALTRASVPRSADAESAGSER